MGPTIKKGTIIMTFDDVLAATSYAQYKYLTANTAKYGKFLDLMKLRTESEVMGRDMINIQTWLLRKDLLSSLSKEQIYFILAEVYSAEKKDFFETDYLADMEPTEIAKKTLMNRAFSDSTAVSKAVIVIKYRNGIAGDLDRKKAFCLRWFGEDGGKYDILPVSEKESAAEAINAKYPKWDIVVTDDVNLVSNLAKGDIDHREFLLPRFGYDKAPDELEALIRLKSATLSYYTPKYNG